MKDIKCPFCKKSFYIPGPSVTTAVYYPPIIKDGVNINPDRNTSTTTCECLECHNFFYIKECGGKTTVVKK